jgi:hypothetical protein
VDPKLITPFVVAALVIWGIYRRLRRSFGRQTVRPGRMWFRIGVFAVVGGLILVSSLRDMPTLGALLGGLVCGTALGYLGIKHTQFEVTPQGSFYTPHTYIGLVVTALFLGRLLYRFLSVYGGAQAVAPTNQNFLNTYQKSPLTMAIFGVLIGYYVLFNLGVLQKTKVPVMPAEERGKP